MQSTQKFALRRFATLLYNFAAVSRHRTPAADFQQATRLVIGPNASLTDRQAWVCAGATGLVGLAIAAAFTVLGYWPILPFAGVELAAVGAALYVSVQHNRYREVVTLADEALRIEFGILGRGVQSMVELPRSWIRVAIEPGLQRNDPSRLLLSCCGQCVEIGRCLTDPERERLAARLKELLKPIRSEGADPAGGEKPAQASS